MNLLVLSAWFPFPGDNGSKIRTQQLLRALAASHAVDLACFYQQDRELAARSQAEELCRRVAAFPKPAFQAEKAPGLSDLFSPLPRFVRTTFSPALAQKVTEWRAQQRYDAEVCMTWGMAPYALGFQISNLKSQISNPAKQAIVLDQHNIESGIFRRGLRGKRGADRLRGWLTYHKFRRFEARTCAAFSACSVVSVKEREELRRLLPHSGGMRVEIIPNGVDTERLRPVWERGSQAPPATRNLLFTGSLSYGVNVDGLRWFLREVFPGVKARFPDLCLRITGEPSPEIAAEVNGDPRVIFTGYLEEVRPLLQESAALVVPLWQGGGTRLKILEAMAAGLPVVSTAVGAEGLEAKQAQHLLIADTPEEFVAAIGQVLQQPLRTLAMTGRARKLAEQEYDWGPIGRRFVELVEEVAR